MSSNTSSMSNSSSLAHSTYKHHPKSSKGLRGSATARPILKTRASTDKLLSYYGSALADQGLSYVRSASPDQSSSHTAHTSEQSSSSDYSDSDASNPSARAPSSETSSGNTRRSSILSKGGSDRRRVAVMQMDTLDEAVPKSLLPKTREKGSTRSPRELQENLADLAFVAPPDAHPRAYTSLSPPPTVPVTDALVHGGPDVALADKKFHSRSVSENVPNKNPSVKDVGGVAGTQTHAPAGEKLFQEQGDNANNKIRPLIFKLPTHLRSTSSTQSTASDLVEHATQQPLQLPSTPLTSNTSLKQRIITPEIGQSKEIHVPVAAPVIVSVTSADISRPESATSSRQSTSSPLTVMHTATQMSFLTDATSSPYLHYQPGLHSIAGPLPPPPRATFEIDALAPPPPRPPRLNSPRPPRGNSEAIKQASELPSFASAALTSKLPTDPTAPDVFSSSAVHTGQTSSKERQSNHRREGAFPTTSSDCQSISEADAFQPSSPVQPSVGVDRDESTSILAPHSVDHDVENTPTDVATDASQSVVQGVPSVTVIEPPPRLESLSVAPQRPSLDSWTDIPREQSSQDHRRTMSMDHSTSHSSPRRSHSPLGVSPISEAPSPPPKNFRTSLTTNLKRFSSLPRTPSISSQSKRYSSSSTYYSSSRTPSPSVPFHPPPTFRRMRSYSPAAMFCHEVHSLKSAGERSAIYAAKINELYLYDCGLSEWVIEAQYRSSLPNGGPSPNQHFTPQPRHTSRSSMMSEATFPRRPDASTATDLSFSSCRDITPPSVIPTLPYPSLAMNQPRTYPTRSSSSAGSGTPPSSIRSLGSSSSTNKTGFFASLGRKTSISKRDKSATPAHSSNGSFSSGRMLTKTPTSTSSISRPIINLNSPTVPGGPRAPPNRAVRSQTLIVTATPFASGHDTTLGRRPSMFNMTLEPVIDIKADPEFVRQVDKLADVLPKADREVLAGYLRRAGQDILAIGQYLEDEKNGKIQAP